MLILHLGAELPAWNRRSPFQCSASIAACVVGKLVGAVPGISHWVRTLRLVRSELEPGPWLDLCERPSCARPSIPRTQQIA